MELLRQPLARAQALLPALADSVVRVAAVVAAADAAVVRVRVAALLVAVATATSSFYR
jgi:hypothetical protein